MRSDSYCTHRHKCVPPTQKGVFTPVNMLLCWENTHDVSLNTQIRVGQTHHCVPGSQHMVCWDILQESHLWTHLVCSHLWTHLVCSDGTGTCQHTCVCSEILATGMNTPVCSVNTPVCRWTHPCVRLTHQCVWWTHQCVRWTQQCVRWTHQCVYNHRSVLNDQSKAWNVTMATRIQKILEFLTFSACVVFVVVERSSLGLLAEL